MIITTTENLNGQEYEVLDVVTGSCVESVHVGKDILSGLKNLVGGELDSYTKMLESTRAKSLDRMKVEASKLGADAIVNIRFSSSQISNAASEILVYGTAVKFL